MDEADRLAQGVGLDALLHSRAGALSYGARRQVEIAMAQAGNPRLLLLDEPAAGLSSVARADLLATPRDVNLLMIEHDVDFAPPLADRVLVMRNGEVIADGTPAEIASNRQIHDTGIGAYAH